MTGQQQESPGSMDDSVGKLLLIGVVIASVLIALGVLGMVLNLQPAQASQLITAGLVVLMLTPILRVATALWIYVREGDFVFAAISLIVLLVLVAGIWMGQVH